MKAEREALIVAEHGDSGAGVKAAGAKAWLREVGRAMKVNWFLFIYMVVLMAGFNSCSHGSQDLYPTFLKNREYCISILACTNGKQRLALEQQMLQ